jgi:hypothetical protein
MKTLKIIGGNVVIAWLIFLFMRLNIGMSWELQAIFATIFALCLEALLLISINNKFN